jgi:predicted GNAT family N-acyltransferase
LEAIGTCRLFYISENVGCIGRVAISSAHRGRKIGGLLLKLAEQHAREVGMKKLSIDSLDDRKEFYSKLGYGPSGKVYIKENLPHIKMVMNLE